MSMKDTIKKQQEEIAFLRETLRSLTEQNKNLIEARQTAPRDVLSREELANLTAKPSPPPEMIKGLFEAFAAVHGSSDLSAEAE